MISAKPKVKNLELSNKVSLKIHNYDTKSTQDNSTLPIYLDDEEEL